MPMEFSVLSSSSSGNATLIKHNDKYYLLDCGIGIRALYNRFNKLNIFVDKISAIFITHEHHDHISGLQSVVAKYNSRVYMSKLTYKNLSDTIKEKVSPINFSFFIPGEEFMVDDLVINTFRTHHDAADPVGFVISDKEKKLSYITDTGCLEPNELIINSDAYILESNHETNLLLMSARPWALKNRILSEFGHLSNEDSVKLFDRIRGDKTKHLILFHLSNECNTKDIALGEYYRYFKTNNIDVSNIDIMASSPNEPLLLIEV
ncbi:MAG: MBL fold metallo-hydrolase [Gammaproteobacteria bacterium]|nr:MBL fold metallo-hydrolase [Gammaproteobacteria bacterium]